MYGATIENSLALLSKEYEQIITDEVSTTITYIGSAGSGVLGSEAKWIIQKIESASGTVPSGITTIKWATSYKNASNVWDNRTSLTYTS